ncbi:unnamed protein product [Cylindrotheca closterium]|uniref:Uncharacterized protein n=1 Tax=Cylindrotheca closterium TaxID=2856 RepID=A0AAD2FGJ6_9STRA|nr:unnamed protein product [Cylindrotheca closterium]
MSRFSRKKRKNPFHMRDFVLVSHPLFMCLAILLGVALSISFVLVATHPDVHVAAKISVEDAGMNGRGNRQPDTNSEGTESLIGPEVPYLPPFAEIENSEQLIEDTLNGKPTVAGIVAHLNKFLKELHKSNIKNSKEKLQPNGLVQTYFDLAMRYLRPLDEPYRGRPIFEIREDDSIFVSLAAFREHLLTQTLKSAFDQAENPENLFIGAAVQNCFGTDGRQCKTGLQVIGKNAQGKDQVKMSDAPPDVNGIEDFCRDPKYEKHCKSGHIRVLYLHDTDALGPAVARYYASKLWGGETYFLQMDSHLEFAANWDTKYIAEIKAAKSFPKAILSSYPPGFTNFGEYSGGSPGTRLCTCQFSNNDVENHIIRINTGGRCKGDEPRPTQIAFIAAGFFFARAEFLIDVPFDPYVPWCFMGEEIALSIRAWTNGWDIYAPRQNLIAHQYRPGRLGLPKFWESVGRDSGRPGLNTKVQKHVLRRIKHMVGYTTDTKDSIEAEGDGAVLTDLEHYTVGNTRSLKDYLELTNIDLENMKCGYMMWCTRGTLE